MVDQKALKKELQARGKSFENTVYELLVNGPQGTVKYLVTPRQVQHCSGMKFTISLIQQQ